LAIATSHTSLCGTLQEHRHQLVDRDTANAAPKNMTEDAHFKILRKNGSSTNCKQHAVQCEYIQTMLNARQFTVYHVAGVRHELHDRFVAASNGKPPYLTKGLVCTVHEIEPHDDVSSVIFVYEILDKSPWQWTKLALITLEKAMEVYMVEVIAASHCLKQ
jgi:hypothetical protein